MSFSQKVDVIPAQINSDDKERIAQVEANKLQRLRWMVLLLSFTAVAIILLIWVWSKPPQFQSQAILHFSYPQSASQEQSAVPEEQVNLNRRRLVSFSVLETLQAQLRDDHQLNYSIEQLSSMISAEAHGTSRIINLSAMGPQPEELKTVLSEWIELYLVLLESETQKTDAKDIQLLKSKQATIENKVVEQRQKLEQFGNQHNIVSLERDENRLLSKVKGLGASIDEAQAQQTEAEALLASVNRAIAEGEQISRPIDQSSIDDLKAKVDELETELAEYAKIYTPEYMSLNANIVNTKRNLSLAKETLEEKLSSSQTLYLQELARNVVSAQNKHKELNAQLTKLNIEAQQFSSTLQQYTRYDNELKQLEAQSQSITDQLLDKEVQKPFEARVDVLESPFVPDYPVGPDYIFYTLISIGIALVVALLCLFVFSFIVRHKLPTTSMTSYTLIPNAGALDQSHAAGLSHQQQNRLPGHSEPLALSSDSNLPVRLLSAQECQQLYDIANPLAKVTITLVLHGLAPQEIVTLQREVIVAEDACLILTGPNGRTVTLPKSAVNQLLNLAESAGGEMTIWPQGMTLVQFDEMMINAAHDADLVFPEQLSLKVLRHTYLTYLMSQGAKLNDLEPVAGFIAPSELGQYRSMMKSGNDIEKSELNTVFPLMWG